MDLVLRNLRLSEGETTVLTDLGIAGGCIAAMEPGLGAESEELDLGGRPGSCATRTTASPPPGRPTSWCSTARAPKPLFRGS